jgi:hypothetical protein
MCGIDHICRFNGHDADTASFSTARGFPRNNYLFKFISESAHGSASRPGRSAA